MNPADSGRDSTGRPRSVEDVEEINRLRAENRNLSAAFLASLAKRRETAGQLDAMIARRDRICGALEDLLASGLIRFAAPRRSAWARDALRHDAREEKALAEAKAAPAAALDPPPPAFTEAETEEGSVGRVHLEVDPTEGAPGE